MFLVRKKKKVLNPLKKSFSFFSSLLFTGLWWHWCGFAAANMISVPCSHSVHTVLRTERTHLDIKKKDKMTWRALDRHLSVSLVLRGHQQSHRCPLWSFKYPHVTTDRSTICPYRPQHHYRLTGRKRRLLGEDMSLFAMPFSPSVPFFFYGQLELLVSTLKERWRFYRPQEIL